MASNDASNSGSVYYNTLSTIPQYIDNGYIAFSPTETLISSTSDMLFSDSHMNDLSLEITIQPVDKFRFRYKSESGSHGGITGEGHSRINKAYPTVKLQNPAGLYLHRKIFIKVSLYTCDDNPRPHVLDLVGKICTNGIGYQKLDNKTSSAKFQGISISNKTKHEVLEILKERKKQELNVSSLNKSQEEETQEELKNLNLNAVKLCFEAVFEDNLDLVPGCNMILSNTIFNLKSTYTGDLKICRLSRCSGKCTGDDEVILLCNKIKKDEIQIKFYEKDEQENILWTTTAKFNPIDVHHQVAIPFKTPKYEGPHLDNLVYGDSVVVWIQLLRKSDEKHGEPVQFTYVCDEMENSKKRKLYSNTENVHSLFSLPDDLSSNLREGVHPEDLVNYKSFFDDVDDLGFSDIVKTDAVDINAGIPFMAQSLPPMAQMGITKVQAIKKDSVLHMTHTSAEKNIVPMTSSGPLVTGTPLIDSKYVSGAIKMDPNVSIPLENSLKSMSLIDSDNVMKECYGTGTEQTRMEKFSLCVKNLLKNKNISYYSSESVTIQDSRGNSLLHLAIMEKNTELIYSILEFIKENLVNHKNLKKETPLHVATWGNHTKVLKLLLNHGGNPYLTNKDGNNCFHLAAIHNFTECMQGLLDFLSSDEEKQFSSNINSLNFDGLAPIHLSIIHNSKDCMKHLLNANADVNVIETKAGKTPFHLAVELRSPLLIDLLSQNDIVIDIEDYRGFTALQNACESYGVSYESISSEATDKQQIASILMEFSEKQDSNEASFQDGNGTESEASDEDEYFEEKVQNFLNSNKRWKKLGPIINVDEESLDILGKMDKNPAKTLIRKIRQESNLDAEEFSGSTKKTLLCILEMAGLDDAVKHL